MENQNDINFSRLNSNEEVDHNQKERTDEINIRNPSSLTLEIDDQTKKASEIENLFIKEKDLLYQRNKELLSSIRCFGKFVDPSLP